MPFPWPLASRPLTEDQRALYRDEMRDFMRSTDRMLAAKQIRESRAAG